MAEQRPQYGIFLHGQDEPVAIGMDADALQQQRKREYGDAGIVERLDADRDDIRDLLASREPAVPAPGPDGMDRIRAEVRSEHSRADMREQAEADVAAEEQSSPEEPTAAAEPPRYRGTRRAADAEPADMPPPAPDAAADKG